MATSGGVYAALDSGEAERDARTTSDLQHTLTCIGSILVVVVMIFTTFVVLVMFPSPTGPPGILSNYLISRHHLPRPAFFYDAVNASSVSSMSCLTSGVVTPHTALYVFANASGGPETAPWAVPNGGMVVRHAATSSARLLTDADGTPIPLLPLAAGESLHTHHIVPVSVASSTMDQVDVFYDVRRYAPSASIPSSHSFGVATSTPAAPLNVTRAFPSSSSFPFHVAGTVVSDGYLYHLALRKGWFDYKLHVARVAAASASDPGASFEFWDGTRWNGKIVAGDSAPLVTGLSSSLSVAYNKYLGQWLMLHSSPASARVYMRTAPSLSGPWSMGYLAVDAAPRTGASTVIHCPNLLMDLAPATQDYLWLSYSPEQAGSGDALPYFAGVGFRPKEL